VEHRLRPGALIVADNADYRPHYMTMVRAPDGGDVELSMKRGLSPTSQRANG
jgi:predicted O-methyltransferase YrrM